MHDNMYTYNNTSDQHFLGDGMNDKYVDEPAIDESALYSAPTSMDHGPQAYQGVPRRGIWRKDELRAFQNQNLFMKIFRILLFVLVIGIILTVCIIMLIFIFLRPPNVGVKDIYPPTERDVDLQGSTFAVPANVSFVVSNPNYVPATIKDITANAYDVVDQNTSVGSCKVTNQEIRANDNTTVTLPCTIKYDLEKDPNLTIIKNIAGRCFNSRNTKLSFLLKVKLKVQLYSFTVPINVNPTIQIDCPVSKQQIEQVLGDKLNLDDILKKLNARGFANVLDDFSMSAIRRRQTANMVAMEQEL